MRSSTHSPLDSTGSATESTTSSAVNDESNHAISTIDDSTKEEELDDDGKDLDGSNTMLNDTSTDDVTKAMNAIDASSTNEDEDSGKLKLYEKNVVQSIVVANFIFSTFHSGFCIIVIQIHSLFFSYFGLCL